VLHGFIVPSLVKGGQSSDRGAAVHANAEPERRKHAHGHRSTDSLLLTNRGSLAGKPVENP
jgi:hypothetical protein